MTERFFGGVSVPFFEEFFYFSILLRVSIDIPSEEAYNGSIKRDLECHNAIARAFDG